MPLVSTGRAEQLELQRRLYGAADEDEVRRSWLEDLARVPSARAVFIGIPSDVGAGYRRGANLAPAAIRSRLLQDDPTWPARARATGVVDLGDVLVVPQLLDDEKLSDAQKAATRRAIHPDIPDAERTCSQTASQQA